MGAFIYLCTNICMYNYNPPKTLHLCPSLNNVLLTFCFLKKRMFHIHMRPTYLTKRLQKGFKFVHVHQIGLNAFYFHSIAKL